MLTLKLFPSSRRIGSTWLKMTNSVVIKMTFSSLPQTTTKLSVLDAYRDKTVFLTGVTGFVGKLLLKKLVSDCQVKRVFVLIREKRSQSAQQRLSQLISTDDLLFKQHRDKMNTVVRAINGDITKPGLGISEQDREMLINQVNVAFHSAANVSFLEPFNNFFEANIEGTNSVMELCQQMKHLKSVVYLSTAFSNCQLKEIKEQVYPVVEHQDFESYYKKIENLRFEDPFPSKLLNGRPNYYTFSKAIAEWMIQERYKSLPVIICRPVTVIGSLNDPIPGWFERTPGSSALKFYLNISLGVNRSVITDGKVHANYLPVDLVANNVIVCGAYRCSSFYQDDYKVVHAASSNPIIYSDAIYCYHKLAREEFPSMQMIRPSPIKGNPNRTIIDKIKHQKSFIADYIFAYYYDALCKVTNRKPFLVKAVKGNEFLMNLFQPFTCNEWLFHTNNIKHIRSLLNEHEQKLFNTDDRTIQWPLFLKDWVLGVRRHMLMEPDSNLEDAKRRYRRMKIQYNLFKVCSFMAVCGGGGLLAWMMFDIHYRNNIQIDKIEE